MNSRARLDAFLKQLAEDEREPGSPSQLSEEEIEAKHEKIRNGIERWEGMNEKQRAYQEWIASPRWRELKRQRLRLDGYICQGCGGSATTAHHIWYPKEEFWDETPLWVLVSLCESCHKTAHRIFPKSVPWPIHE